jgi:circadian clock protein KaiC
MKKENKRAKLTLPKKAVSKPAKVTIHQLPSGVRGLDEILGGGIPEFSFNIIGGTPGCGKTTMAH